MPSLPSKINRCVCALMLCAAVIGSPANGAILSTSPSSASVVAGQQFTLVVIVSGLSAGQAIGGFDLDLVFNPLLLAPDYVTFGDRLGTLNVDQITSALLSSGRIDFSAVSLMDELSLLGLQSGPFMLAQMVFNALAPGSSAIDFDDLTAPGLLLSDQFGNAIAVTGGSGSIVRVTQIAEIAEPPTVLLLMSGIVIAIGRRAVRKVRALRQTGPM